MFEKLFKKTTEKAEVAIDKTTENIDSVISDAKIFINETKYKVKNVTILAVAALGTIIVSNILTISVCHRASKMLK